MNPRNDIGPAVPLARRLAIPLSVAVAIGAPAAQALLDLGLSQAEFARDGDETLRAAGYAFSIWSLIYAGLIAYAAYQARPGARDTPMLQQLAWPSVIAILGCASWIVASSQDWKWASVAIIVISAAAMLASVDRGARETPFGLDRQLALWPLSLLAGWLTIASAINILTVMTATGLIGAAQQTAAAIAGVAAVTLVGGWFTRRSRQSLYAAPIAWGLIAVYVAERGDQPIASWSAMAGAVLVSVVAASTMTGRKAAA